MAGTKSSKKRSKRASTINKLLNNHNQHQHMQNENKASLASKNVNFFVTASIVFRSCKHKVGSLLLRGAADRSGGRKKESKKKVVVGQPLQKCLLILQ